jgi:hypothetical protein
MVVAAASADVGGYTHLVKVDDDTLVRVCRLRHLIGGQPRWGGAASPYQTPC